MTSTQSKPLAYALGAGILAALLAAPAQAQTATATGASFMDTAYDMAGDAWTSVKTYFTPHAGTPMISRELIAQTQDDELAFKSLMDVAGYKVKEIETGVSVVPYFSMTFGKARELSEADETHLSRLLRKHERTKSGPIAFGERRIVSAVLDLQRLRDYTLEKVEVDLLPLPKVKFVASPADAPMGEEASRIIRAIEALNTSPARAAQR